MIRLMAAIKCISHCSTLYRAEALEAEGLGGYQQTYLLHICEKPGITQEELRKKYSQDKSTIARRAAKLEKEGYIVRRPHPVDGRRKQLYITEKGAMLRDAKVEAESFFFQWLTEELSDEELGQLCPLLERIQLRSRTERRAQFETLLARYQKTHPDSGSDQ